MEHLNYCRQLARSCMDLLEIPGLPADRRALLRNVLDLHGASVKFMLPEGGRLLDDHELRALNENEPLRLPYRFIALEFRALDGQREPDEPICHFEGRPIFQTDDAIAAPKRVIFAREREGYIVLTVAFWTNHDGLWRVLPECALPCHGWLDRRNNIDGRPQLKFAFDNLGSIPPSDYADEIAALLDFLNALACSNVRIERSEPRRSGRKVKTALPFDAYHVLTIDVHVGASERTGRIGGHRSPREHLRRGHIRRLADGRRVWVNATVVAAGRGAGVVSKDYRLRGAEAAQ